jgi:hypothetical protein
MSAAQYGNHYDRAAATGNSSKIKAKEVKKAEKKANAAMFVLIGLAGLGGLGYIVYKHRDALVGGGAAAARALGPIVSRVLPAIVLSVLVIWMGPETLIASVPAGLFFGPEMMSALAGLLSGMGSAGVGRKTQAAGVLMQGLAGGFGE